MSFMSGAAKFFDPIGSAVGIYGDDDKKKSSQPQAPVPPPQSSLPQTSLAPGGTTGPVMPVTQQEYAAPPVSVTGTSGLTGVEDPNKTKAGGMSIGV